METYSYKVEVWIGEFPSPNMSTNDLDSALDAALKHSVLTTSVLRILKVEED